MRAAMVCSVTPWLSASARLVACYDAGGRPPDMAQVTVALAGLAAFKRPKRYVAVADWPRNAQGKLNRAALLAVAASR